MDICIVLDITPEQLLTGKGINDNYVSTAPTSQLTQFPKKSF